MFQCLFFLLLLLTACGPQSLEDYRREGKEAIRSLTKELSQIQTRQELISSQGKIKKIFDQMVDLMIAAEEHYEAHSNEILLPLESDDLEFSDQLRIEIERIKRIEGAEAILVKCQEEATERLHTYNQKKSRM